MMKKITKTFDLKVYTFSKTAIINGIQNSTNDETIIQNLQNLHNNVIVHILENFQDYDLYITSGYRSPELNKKIGGAKNSQHLKGQAADILLIKGSKLCNELLFEFLKDVEHDQLIAERMRDGKPAWIHVSYNSEGNRNQTFSS